MKPTLTWNSSQKGQFLKRPPIADHCSRLLHGSSNQGIGKFLKRPPSAAHSYMEILVRGWGQSSKVLPLQPTFTCSFSEWVIPQKSSHYSPVQPTLTWQFQSGLGVVSQKYSLCSPLQPHTLTWQLQLGGVFLKSLLVAAHCSPTLLHVIFS